MWTEIMLLNEIRSIQGLASYLNSQIDRTCEQKKSGAGTLYTETVLSICQ